MTTQAQLSFDTPVDELTHENSTVFRDNMTRAVHRWFRFSAGFAADWAESVIREHLGARGTASVLDPFAGSATTLLAAQAAGAEIALGVEAHPFVTRVARTKLLWRSDVRALEARSFEVVRFAEPRMLDSPPALLAKCYPPEVLAELEGLRLSIEANCAGDAADELLWLALVAVLRECSPVGTANWQYVLPNKRKARVADPVVAFRAKVSQMVRDMREWQATVSEEPQATLLDDDARWLEAVEDDSVGLVVTSPPYPNNFDYADATRLEMTFLGEVRDWAGLHVAVRERLVRSCSQHMRAYGAAAEQELRSTLLAPIAAEIECAYRELEELREIRAGKKNYHWMIVAYFTDLAKTWAALRRVCVPGAKVCFVVGDSAPYGVHVPVERWLGELALASGFNSWEFEKLRDRNNKWLNRKHRVPLHEGRLWVEG